MSLLNKQVKLSVSGVKRWSGVGEDYDSYNPQDCVGVVTYIADGKDDDLLIHVKWDNGCNNSYDESDLEEV